MRDLEEFAGVSTLTPEGEEMFFRRIQSTLEMRDANIAIEFLSSSRGRIIISAYFDLNDQGKAEAAKRILELTEIAKFKASRLGDDSNSAPPEGKQRNLTHTQAEEKPPEGNGQPPDGK